MMLFASVLGIMRESCLLQPCFHVAGISMCSIINYNDTSHSIAIIIIMMLLLLLRL